MGTVLASATSPRHPLCARGWAVRPRARRMAAVALCALGLLGSGCSFDPLAPDAGAPPDLQLTRERGALAGPTDPARGDGLLVMLRPGADASAVAGRHGLAVRRRTLQAGLVLLEGGASAARLRADEDVLRAQPNRATSVAHPSDLVMSFLEGVWTEGEYVAQDALAPLALPDVHGRADGSGVRVGVLDTGVDPLHPHLQGRLELRSVLELAPPLESANGLDDDLDGATDEGYGHGTHVAGILATVAPAAVIVPFKVFGEEGIGDEYMLAVGLSAALEAGVDVVNLSLRLESGSPVIDALLDQLAAAGIPVVAAAGNESGPPSYPASRVPCVGVAAAGSDDVLAAFSASGTVALAAPGVTIASSFPGGQLRAASGTSMACAVVSGCVALLMGPGDGAGLVASAAVDRLFATAAPLSPAGAVVHGRIAPLVALGP